MNDWRPFVYGGVSSVLAETGTFPIDTTKTRLQIQGQVIDSAHAKIKYRGMLHAFTRIFSEEGVAALYAGLAPALLRQATYGTIKIGIYHSLKRTFFTEFREERLLPNICCGCVAGMVASTIANPTDVLKVRLQAHNADFENMGMARAFSEIYYNEGVRGLWRGVGPTATRAAVVAGVELPVYDWCKKLLIYTANFSDGVHTHFLSSFIAGFAGAVASNPIDVVRTRLMNQRKLVNTSVPHQRIYSGSIDCFLQTYRTEGFWALYRGFIPNWLRLGPWNIIFFISFEQLKKTY